MNKPNWNILPRDQMRPASSDHLSSSGFYIPPPAGEEAEAQALKQQMRDAESCQGRKDGTPRADPEQIEARAAELVTPDLVAEAHGDFGIIPGLVQERPVQRQEAAVIDPMAWEYSVL